MDSDTFLNLVGTSSERTVDEHTAGGGRHCGIKTDYSPYIQK